jgi:hypothetical protein
LDIKVILCNGIYDNHGEEIGLSVEDLNYGEAIVLLKSLNYNLDIK